MDPVDKFLLSLWVIGAVSALLGGEPKARKRFIFTTVIGLLMAWASS